MNHQSFLLSVGGWGKSNYGTAKDTPIKINLT
jgi:hypothetical protein